MSKSLLGTYLQFLRSPDLNAPPIVLSKAKIITSILRLYSVHLVVLLAVLVVISLVPNVQESNNLLDTVDGMPVWYLPLTAVVVAPVLEETIFRLPLRPSWLNLALPVAIFVPAFSGALPMPGLLILLLIAIALLAIFSKKQSPKSRSLQTFYNRYSRFIFYGIALLFGIIHIGNYDAEVWSFLPILVFPQIVIGLILGFVRLRYGLAWGMLLHAFHNGVLLLPVFLVQILGSEHLQASITEPLDWETLSRSDQIMMGGLSLCLTAGIILVGVTAWKVVREYSYDTNTGTRL